jgi:UDP-N-acetylglucosamine enolpyruvyl transferase
MAVAIPVFTLVDFLPMLRVPELDDEREMAAAIERLGGKVRLEGDKVVEVNLEGRRIRDDDLKVLQPLRHIRKLDLE